MWLAVCLCVSPPGGYGYTLFKELFDDKVKLRIRFSLNNLKLDGDVLNIPLFMTDHTDRLIGLALTERGKE